MYSLLKEIDDKIKKNDKDKMKEVLHNIPFAKIDFFDSK